MLNKTKTASILISILFSLIFAMVAQAADATDTDRANILKSWTERGKKAETRHKELMGKETRTASEECEANLERGYLVAYTMLLHDNEKGSKGNIEASVTLGGGKPGIIVTFDYGLMGKLQSKVQMVKIIGNFLQENQLMMGGEKAQKGELVIKSGKCLFFFNDQQPLEATFQAI